MAPDGLQPLFIYFFPRSVRSKKSVSLSDQKPDLWRPAGQDWDTPRHSLGPEGVHLNSLVWPCADTEVAQSVHKHAKGSLNAHAMQSSLGAVGLISAAATATHAAHFTEPYIFVSSTGLISRTSKGKYFALLSALSRQVGFLGQEQTNLRLHVEQVAHSHVGVALPVPVALREELVLRPGHVNPIRGTFSFVVYCGVRRCVSVVDELGLEPG